MESAFWGGWDLARLWYNVFKVFACKGSAFGVLGFCLWIRRLHFTALASGIALSSRSLDGVDVFGFVLWIGGPIGGILQCLILA